MMTFQIFGDETPRYHYKIQLLLFNVFTGYIEANCPNIYISEYRIGYFARYFLNYTTIMKPCIRHRTTGRLLLASTTLKLLDAARHK